MKKNDSVLISEPVLEGGTLTGKVIQKMATSVNSVAVDIGVPDGEAQAPSYETGADAIGRTDTQKKIGNVLCWLDQLLVYKNKNYGNSALEPLGLFTKFLSESNDPGLNSILVRLDDKLMRVKNAKTLRSNDVMDIMGYLTLLLVSMGVTFEDFKAQMD